MAREIMKGIGKDTTDIRDNQMMKKFLFKKFSSRILYNKDTMKRHEEDILGRQPRNKSSAKQLKTL